MYVSLMIRLLGDDNRPHERQTERGKTGIYNHSIFGPFVTLFVGMSNVHVASVVGTVEIEVKESSVMYKNFTMCMTQTSPRDERVMKGMKQPLLFVLFLMCAFLVVSHSHPQLASIV